MVLILILILTLILLIIVRVSALLPSGGRSKVEDFSINFGPEALGTPCRSYPSAGGVVLVGLAANHQHQGPVPDVAEQSDSRANAILNFNKA